MAEVRDGWDTRLHRPVAVKLMHPAFNAQPGIRGRFEDEARSAAKLSHPKIVAVYDFGEHDSTPYYLSRNKLRHPDQMPQLSGDASERPNEDSTSRALKGLGE